MKRLCIPALLALSVAAGAQTPAPAENHDLGFKDTPILPGLPWHVHDPDRPHPPVVTPSTAPGGPPSDAIVLFDGKDLSHWQSHASTITHAGDSGAPQWKVGDGYVEIVPHTGDIATKDNGRRPIRPPAPARAAATAESC
jgi:hypothetical protein